MYNSVFFVFVYVDELFSYLILIFLLLYFIIVVSVELFSDAYIFFRMLMDTLFAPDAKVKRLFYDTW